MISKHVPLADLPALMGRETLDVTLKVYTHGITTSDHREAAIGLMADEMEGDGRILEAGRDENATFSVR